MNIRQAPAGTIRASLRYPAFRRLLGGLAVSQLGDWLYNLALVALVYERTHGDPGVGVTTAARVVPMVALGPLGGIVTDRFDRRRVMITSDVIRAGLMLLLAAVAAARLPIVLAPVLAAVATAVATPYLPSVAATTPRLVPDPDLPGANAARSAVSGLGGTPRLPGAGRALAAGPLARAGLRGQRPDLRPVGPGRAGHPGWPGLPPRAVRSAPGGCAARGGRRCGRPARPPRRAAPDRRGHHVQRHVRRPDGAAPPGVPLPGDGHARLRVPVRGHRRRGPDRHGPGRPGPPRPAYPAAGRGRARRGRAADAAAGRGVLARARDRPGRGDRGPRRSWSRS